MASGTFRQNIGQEHAKTRGAVVMAHNYIRREQVRVNRLLYVVAAQMLVLVALVAAKYGITVQDALPWLLRAGAVALGVICVILLRRAWSLRVRRGGGSGAHV